MGGSTLGRGGGGATGACAKGLYSAGSLPGYYYYYCYCALFIFYLFYFMTRLAFPPSLSAQVRVDREGSCLPTNPPAMMQAGRQAGRHPPLSHSGTTPDSGGHSGTPTNGGTGSCNPAHMSIRPHSQVYMISKQLIYYWMHASLYYYYYTCR